MNLKTILGNRLVIRREPPREYHVLPRPCYRDISIPDGPGKREPHFEAIVLAVGRELSEDLKPGDRIVCGAHPSQDRVGTRQVMWQGESAELMSTLDVTAVIIPMP